MDLQAFPSIARNYSPNIVFPYSGIGLSIGHGINRNLEAGISFRSVPWGSEVSLSEGYRIKLMDTPAFEVKNTSKLFIGIPLYYNKFSLSSALSSEVL